MPLEKRADKKNKGEEQNPYHGKNVYKPPLPVPINLEIALHLALTEMCIQIQKQCCLSIVCPSDPPAVLSAGTGDALKYWATPPKASQKGSLADLTDLAAATVRAWPLLPRLLQPSSTDQKYMMKPKAGHNFAEYL